MALLHTGELSKLFGTQKDERRFENWLWLYLGLNHQANFDSNVFTGGQSRELMAKLIQQQKIDIGLIKENRDRSLVLNSTIQWIEDNQRQNQWITNYIKKNINHAILEIPRLQGKERVIATIDILGLELNQKKHFIDTMHNSWNIKKQEDTVFDWFKQENQELRYKVAHEFSMKKFTGHTLSIFNTPQPISFCNHDDLLMFMDGQNLSMDEKKYWLDGVKKLYHQKQYRKNLNGKKQYNFILTESTSAKLDDLATRYSLSRAEIIELLIKMEATKPTHIPERLQYVKNMTFDAAKAS